MWRGKRDREDDMEQRAASWCWTRSHCGKDIAFWHMGRLLYPLSHQTLIKPLFFPWSYKYVLRKMNTCQFLKYLAVVVINKWL